MSNRRPSQSHFADQSFLSKGDLGDIAPNTIANTTRRSNRMLEYILATSRMRGGVSSTVTLVAMKTKYVAARITKGSTATQTQPLSLSLTATL